MSLLDSGITRRQLLQAAGGITFMAFVPDGNGAFAAPAVAGASMPGPLPVFIALPYLQHGPGPSKLVEGQEAIAIAWQTNGVAADFTLEYGPTEQMGQTATISKTVRTPGKASEAEKRFNYMAALTNLNLGKRYNYRVRMKGETLLEGYFTTRKPRGTKTRFVAFGDNSYGEISDRAIAYQAYQAHPDFVMNTGDNVYEGGLDNEYARYFFPVYNADVAGSRLGAPLLRSVPFYTVIANHDVHGKDADKNPAADFGKEHDSLAYFTNLYLPSNGPEPTYKTPVVGPQERIADFAASAGGRFPRMANYSFDYADLHFLCLDANVYVDPTDKALQTWIAADLASTDATWKFVVYHHPAFNAGFDHYDEQHMRVLSPIFEKHGVDVVLHGHEHTYQRTRPFKFAPTDESGAKERNGKNRLVPGNFTIDRKFDGVTATKPDGVLYIVTGAGGKHLYDPESTNNPAKWLHPEDKNADYVARFVSDRHSLTVFDVDAHSVTLKQIDEWGNEIDQCKITKI